MRSARGHEEIIKKTVIPRGAERAQRLSDVIIPGRAQTVTGMGRGDGWSRNATRLGIGSRGGSVATLEVPAARNGSETRH